MIIMMMIMIMMLFPSLIKCINIFPAFYTEQVYGDWLPRYVDIGPLKKIFSRGTGKITDRRFNAICGIVRMMYLSAILFFKTLFAPDGIGSGHVVFLDGLSQSIPIISACGLPVLFYCHFPDALLSPINISSASDTQSSSSIAGILKRGYRDLVDWLESATMQQAALIAGMRHDMVILDFLYIFSYTSYSKLRIYGFCL